MRQTFDDQADPSFGPRHLPLIRAEMARQGLDGFLIPHEDEHQNEYLPDANERLAWATGFTGSAGAAVVLADKAAVFVDGRYTLQVKDQVDAGAVRDRATWSRAACAAYLEAAARPGQVIGYDPRLHSPDALARLSAAAAKAGAELQPGRGQSGRRGLDATARPSLPAAGRAPPAGLRRRGVRGQARARRRGDRRRQAPTAAVITAPASIAWLFNIRGGDVIRSPLPAGPGDPAGRRHGAAVPRSRPRSRPTCPPGSATRCRWSAGGRWSRSARRAWAARRCMVDPAQSSAWYFDALEAAGAEVVRAPIPSALPRACKNAGRDRRRAPRPPPRRRGPDPLPALAGHRGADEPARRGGDRRPAWKASARPPAR